MKEENSNPPPFLKDWRVDAAILISVLALAAYFTQAYFTRKAMRLDQRAWVGFDEIKGWTLEINQPFVMAIPLKNLGKTPAIKLAAGFQLATIPKAEKPQYDSVVDPTVGPSTALMLPGQVHEMKASIYIHERGTGNPLLPLSQTMLVRSYLATWLYTPLAKWPTPMPSTFSIGPPSVLLRNQTRWTALDFGSVRSTTRLTPTNNSPVTASNSNNKVHVFQVYISPIK